jgi:hypothetical protein
VVHYEFSSLSAEGGGGVKGDKQGPVTRHWRKHRCQHKQSGHPTHHARSPQPMWQPFQEEDTCEPHHALLLSLYHKSTGNTNA